MGLLVRILLFIAAPVTALFVARDAMNFGVIQTIVATFLIAAVTVSAAVWTARK